VTRIAILDDYQNTARDCADWTSIPGSPEIVTFGEHIPGEQAVADALAVREALEPLLVRDAARHRTKRQVRRLRSRVHEVETALDDHDAFVRAVWALHEDIAEISPNELLRAIYLAVLRGIDDSAVRATSGLDSTDSSAEYRRHRLRVHAELVEAIAAAESEAVERALERHRGERA